jgi:MoaA/NifB/PqqE/SkfB family radical SAM enzyme
MIYPKLVFIESTNYCNAHCIMCPNDRLIRPRGIIDTKLFCKIINDCDEIPEQFTLLLHKEGEPLMDPKLIDKIRYANNKLGKKAIITISTNASMLTKEKSDALLSSGLSQIIFSLDGATKEHYERIRLGLNYDVTLNNILYFMKKREETGAKVSVVMQMISDDSEADRKEASLFIKQWQDYRCKIYIKRMHSYLDGNHSSLTKTISSEQKRVCQDPFNIIVISCDGSAVLCCWDYNDEYSIGNAKTSSVVELFNNSKACAMREKQTAMKCPEIKPCQRCARIFGDDYITGKDKMIDLETGGKHE